MTPPAERAGPPHLADFVDFSVAGIVRIRTGKVEIGQGLHEALRRIAAEELEVSPTIVEIVPPNTASSPDEGITSGSNSIAQAGRNLMVVCANVRERFRHAFAGKQGVAPEAVVLRDGTFLDANVALGTYWSGETPVDLHVPVDPAIDVKPRSAHQLVGTDRPHPELATKISGRKTYITDLALPNMLHGRVIRPASQHYTIERAPEPDLASHPGLVAWVRRGRFLGVIADSEYGAHELSRRLAADVVYRFDADLADLEDAPTLLPQEPAARSLVHGAETPPREGDRRLAARYFRPFLAHASIGLSCAIGWFEAGRLRLWSHSQGIFHLRREVATVTGLDAAAVEIQHVEAAGCYGHNGADDAALDAALLAMAHPGAPIRVQWTREDELGNAPFGAAMVIDLAATLADDGAVTSWRHEIWSNGHVARPGRTDAPTLRAGPELDVGFSPYVAINTPVATGGAAERNAVPIYRFPNLCVVNNRLLHNRIRTSSLRSLGAFGNVFALEGFIDEIAAATGSCPYAFRRRYLDDPRAIAVLADAVERSGFQGRPNGGDGHGFGCAVAKYKNLGAYCACVAEVEVGVEVRVRRLVLSVDVGLPIDPDGVANQIEGGALQAMSWALEERVRFTFEGVAGLDWETYPILRFSKVPELSVRLLDSAAPPVGAGEAAHGPVAAALGNAASHALGVRLRHLPLTREAIIAAIGVAG